MSDPHRPADEPKRDFATRKLSDPNATVNLSADEVAALRDATDKATRKLDNPFATVSLSREEAAALRDTTQTGEPTGNDNSDKATRKLDNPFATVSLSREEAAALRAESQSAPTAPAVPITPPAAPNPFDSASANLRGGAVADQESAAGKSAAATNQGWSGNDQTVFGAAPAQGYAPPPSQPASNYNQPPNDQTMFSPSSAQAYAPPSQPAAQNYNQPYAPSAPNAQNYPQSYGSTSTGSQPNAFPATPILSSAPSTTNNNKIAFILMGLGVLLILVALVLALV